MTQPSRIAKRLLLPALLALALIAVQVVLAAPPQPSFTIVGPNFTTTCGLYTFTSTSTDPDDDIDTIDLGHRGHAQTGSSVTETFANPGTRTINMTATDTDAGDGTVDPVAATPQTVNVGNGGNPNAAFSAEPQPGPAERRPSRSTPRLGRAGRRLDRQVRVGPRRQRHGYELDTGAVASATGRATPTTGVHTVSLRVTDNCGGTDTDAWQRLRQQHRAHGLLHGHAQPGRDRRDGHLQRHRLERPGRLDRQVRVGSRRRRHVRDRHRHRRHHDEHLHGRQDLLRQAEGHRRQRRDQHRLRQPQGQRQAGPELLLSAGGPADRPGGHLRRHRLGRPRRHGRELPVGPRRQRQLRGDRRQPDAHLQRRRHGQRQAARDRQRQHAERRARRAT